MSKKSSKQKTKKAVAKASVVSGGGIVRPLLPLICMVLLAGAAAYGLERLKDHVYRQPVYHPTIRLSLVDPPQWVAKEKWDERILSSVELPTSEQWMDADLIERIAAQLANSGWVRRVDHVTKRMDGTIEVTCDYRRPIAMLLTDEGYLPVDRDGVRMPEVYPSVSTDSGWLRIVGVESDVPSVNRSFAGDDAKAAVRLASLIFEQGDEVASRISAIDVINFRGRRDRRACHIKLWTPTGSEIKWGSAIGEEVEENTAVEKITQIAIMLKQGEPKAQVDVSVYPDVAILPATQTIETAEGNRNNR